ncbi:unannotated protein [freshwater metagenome]|uniref:Unannotated protein n=1 Tax=freshwater metagenome TaxID=449393 RepID=A0A6J7UU03_9ZZZZ
MNATDNDPFEVVIEPIDGALGVVDGTPAVDTDATPSPFAFTALI